MGQIDGYQVVVTASNAAAIAGLGGAAVRRVAREGARVTLVTPEAGAAGKSLAGSLGERMRLVEAPLQQFSAAVTGAAKDMGGLDALVNVVQPDTPWQSF